MSRKTNGVNYPKNPQVRVRRENVIERLNAQLESGVKNTKTGQEVLSDKDIKRIEKEIEILKQRV